MTGPIQAGLQWAQNLNQALAQHAELQERQRANLAQEAMRQAEINQQGQRDQANQAHQSLADQLSVMANGGSPVDAGGNYQATVTPNPDASQNTANPVLNDAANAPMTGRLAAQPGQVVGAGGQKYRMPTASETAQNDLDQKVKTAQALQKARGMVRLGENIAGPLGFDPNMRVPVESVGSLSEAAERAKPTGPKYQFHYETDGNGNVSAFRTDALTGKVEQAGTFRGAAGSKVGGGTSDPNAPPDKRTAAAITQHDKLFDQENKIHALRQQMGFDITQPDGETVIDPMSGKETLMGAARRKFYQDQVDKLGQQAKDIEAQRMQLRQNFKLGEFAPNMQKQSPAVAQAGQPAKVLTAAQLAQFAAQKKMTPRQAMAMAKQYGYTVQ